MAAVNNNNNNPTKNKTPSSSSPVHVSQRSAGMKSFKVMDILQRANELEAEQLDDGTQDDDKVVVLHCEVGQPETGAPKRVAQAAVDALTTTTTTTTPQNKLGYTDAFGLLPLRQEIARHYQRHYNLNKNDNNNDVDSVVVPSVSQIVITTGSSGAFLLAFTACFDAGDVVAIASVGYPCYRNILSVLGCSLAHINVNHEFKLTAVELQAEITKRQQQQQAAADDPKKEQLVPRRIKGLILSSPSNPTGAMLTPQELQDLCKLCDEHDIQFISDEIYHGISYGNIPEATALQFSNRAIVINSFSKYYSSTLYIIFLRYTLLQGEMEMPDVICLPCM